MIQRLRDLIYAPATVLKNLFLYRHLLFQMVKREVQGRFAGSAGGFLWHFIHPVLMIVIYLFVFVTIFKMRIGEGGSGASALYLMAGLFPWMIVAEGLSRGTSAFIENATLIQKTAFPIEVLTAKAVLAPFFSHGIALVLLTAYTVFAKGSVVVLAFIPLALLLQAAFTLGVAFLTSTLSIFFRDVLQFMQVLLAFWIYATPILYPVSMLPEWAKTAVYFNPLFPLVSIFQALFVSGTPGPPEAYALAAAWSALFFLAGSFFFGKLKYEFADWL